MSRPDFDTAIASLASEFSRSGVAELHVRRGDFELFLSNRSDGARVRRQVKRENRGVQNVVPATALAVQPVAVNPSPAPDLPAAALILRAPNLGTFYRAPKPGAAPYVEVGAIVAEGDELCLIEVMKLFTAVRAECAGRIHSVIAEDGSMVEAGEPLFALVAG